MMRAYGYLRLATVLALSVLIAFPLAGCKTLVNKIAAATPNNPEVREKAVSSARNSCMQAATAHVGASSPAVQAKVASYCDCFATRGLAKFSNQELAVIGLEGKSSMSPDQMGKLNDAMKMCMQESFRQ